MKGNIWASKPVRIFGGIACLALIVSTLSFVFVVQQGSTKSSSLYTAFRKATFSSEPSQTDDIYTSPSNDPHCSSPTRSEFDKHLSVALDKMDHQALQTLIKKAQQQNIHSSSLNLAQFVIDQLNHVESHDKKAPAKQADHGADPVATDKLHSHGNQYGHEHESHQQIHDVDNMVDSQFDGLDVISVKETKETIEKRYNDIIARYPKHPPSSFPIGLVAANRPVLLKRTMTSLLSVVGITPTQVTVYLDGNLQSMLDVVASFPGVKVLPHDNNIGNVKEEGAARIARHYKFTLSHLFDDNPNAAYAIIVEDDMLFSPDFLLYFVQTAHLYESDPSIYCISSFNDNGFRGRVADNTNLFRTEFFIGLGWLASRTVYKALEGRWPNTHWDHWIRSPAQRQGRECIFPEISRNYNIGKIGTHSDESLFQRYFQHIVINAQPAVDLGDLSRMEKAKYEENMLKSLSDATPLSSVNELSNISPSTHPNGVIMWFEAGSDEDKIWQHKIAKLFGLWHTQPNIRGMKDGVATFLHRNVRLYVVGTFSKYRSKIQPQARALDASAWVEGVRSRSEIHNIIGDQGLSCYQTCINHQLQCHAPSLSILNNCDDLKAVFSCTTCDTNEGVDQPAYVSNKEESNYGSCYRSGGRFDFDCYGSHRNTQRLCACVDA